MFRILGFILGSAVSIAAIFMVLGVPEVHLPSTETDQARYDAALKKIRERQPAVEALPEANEALAMPVDVLAETAENAAEETEASSATDSYDAVVATPTTMPQDLHNPEQYWHDFWNPFRSEIAARGFVKQLEKVTGLDYRVLKVEAGVYQVGFAYFDDEERRFKISQISAATGLDLPQT